MRYQWEIVPDGRSLKWRLSVYNADLQTAVVREFFLTYEEAERRLVSVSKELADAKVYQAEMGLAKRGEFEV